MKKIIISLLLAVLCIGMVYGQTAIEPTIGNGSVSTPYEVSQWEHLYWISQGDGWNRWELHYKQTADITFPAGISSWDSNKGWRPLGNSNGSNFSGSYNGQNYSIYNLYINRPNEENVGFFGYATGQIGNVRLINANVTGGKGTGYGYGCAGILVGHLVNSGSIYYCDVQGTLSGLSNIGGLVGKASGGLTTSPTTYGNPIIRYCSADATVTMRDVDGISVGGVLIGSLYKASVKDSYATGIITGRTSHCGGFIGYISSGSYVEDCFSHGKVVRTAGTSTENGGFIATNNNSRIFRNYSTGSVKDGSGNNLSSNNGFVYLIHTGTTYQMTSNFWDKEASGMTGTASNTYNSSEAPLGRTTIQMKRVSNYTSKGWVFKPSSSPKWNIGNSRNNNYPYLNWTFPSDPNPVLTQALNPTPSNSASGIAIPTTLTWEEGILGTPTGYKINFGTNNPPSNIRSLYDNEAITSLSVGNLQLNQTYYWQVVPYNSSEDLSNPPVWSFTTTAIPPAPTTSAATDIGSTNFTANWSVSPGATSYYLDVSTVSNFTSFVTGYQNKDVGNVNSYNVTGLSMGTNYYYRVRAATTAGSSSNSNTVSLTTLLILPTVQASGLVFSDIDYTTFTINWTNGNGMKRAVFVKQASEGAAEPVENNAYTANTNFGSGTQIGSTGWFCVYNGTGTSVTINNLTEGTGYIVHVCEFNEKGSSIKYLTSSADQNPKSSINKYTRFTIFSS